MEAVVVGNFYVNLLIQMRTDYSTPFLCLWDRITRPHTVFDKRVFQFVSVCLRSSWVPALRESSCLSGTELCSSPTCEQKHLVWPHSKLLLCLSSYFFLPSQQTDVEICIRTPIKQPATVTRLCT